MLCIEVALISFIWLSTHTHTFAHTYINVYWIIDLQSRGKSTVKKVSEIARRNHYSSRIVSCASIFTSLRTLLEAHKAEKIIIGKYKYLGEHKRRSREKKNFVILFSFFWALVPVCVQWHKKPTRREQMRVIQNEGTCRRCACAYDKWQ